MNKYLHTVASVGFLFTLNYDARNHELKKNQYTCMIISHSFLRMRNVSGKSRRENQNTHCTFNKSPPENLAVCEIM